MVSSDAAYVEIKNICAGLHYNLSILIHGLCISIGPPTSQKTGPLQDRCQQNMPLSFHTTGQKIEKVSLLSTVVNGSSNSLQTEFLKWHSRNYFTKQNITKGEKLSKKCKQQFPSIFLMDGGVPFPAGHGRTDRTFPWPEMSGGKGGWTRRLDSESSGEADMLSRANCLNAMKSCK